MAILATVWGVRLTFNFARHGAYKLKFWSGEEDYRWSILRSKKEFQPRWKWMIFDLLFISIYQNVLVLMTTFPALVNMNSNVAFNYIDIIAIIIMVAAITIETIADQQQWNFQTAKWGMIKSGKQLPEPYNKGFNTIGLWKYSRHPNYLGEQSTWVGFYIFSIAAGIGIFNWSVIGALLLIVLFIGSSSVSEEITSSKYPEYADYKKQVSRYFFWKRYKNK